MPDSSRHKPLASRWGRPRDSSASGAPGRRATRASVVLPKSLADNTIAAITVRPLRNRRVTFGRGCLAEVGDRARALGMRRVALFTDARVRKLEEASPGRPGAGGSP